MITVNKSCCFGPSLSALLFVVHPRIKIIYLDLVISSGTVQDGNTALIRAARNEHTGCMRLLLDAGADVNAKRNVRVVGLGVW
jgi:ankyrin repeat protein